MALHAIYATGGGGPIFSGSVNLRGNTPETAATATWFLPLAWVSAATPGATATVLPTDPTARGWYSFPTWSKALSAANAKLDGVSITVTLTDGDGNALDEELSLSFSAAAHAAVPDDAAFASLEIDCEFSDGVLYIYRARINWLVNYNSGPFQHSFGAEIGRSHTRSGR